MKKLIILVSLAIAAFCLADDGQGKTNIDQLDKPPVQGGQSNGGFPVVHPPQGGMTTKVNNSNSSSVSTGKRDYFTVPEIESHIKKGSHPQKCGTNMSYPRPTRATTARKSSPPRKGKEGQMPNPVNVTINVPPTNPAGIVNDPDFGGLIQADPNLAIREGASMTYSRNADGGLYYNSTPYGGNLLWLWIVLGVLGAAALIALLARALGGGGNGGGGNNVYHNYPPNHPVAPAPQPAPAPAPIAPAPAPAPQPAPVAPAPAAPAAPQGGAPQAAPFEQPAAPGGGHGHGGWNGIGPVVLLMTPTGSPQQHRTEIPVVVNVHNNFPNQGEQKQPTNTRNSNRKQDTTPSAPTDKPK